MQNRLVVAGFGGQGVMVIGQLLGYASCAVGKNVIWLPAYGPEQRGGTANCTVTISDKEIGSPVSRKIDVLIAMNEPALKKFLPRVKTGGAVLINSSMCNAKVDRDDVQTYYIPADQIASELGSEKVANIVMVGAYIAKSGVLSEEQMLQTIKVKLGNKPELLELNKTALKKGMEMTI